MSRPESLAPMISAEVGTGRGALAEDGRAGGAHAAPDGRRRQLKDGDFLPHEADLIAHFQVSRPTLREAVRVLESERLVEVRRGSRTGAKVRVPGPEIVARPAGLLLALSGTTLADVMTARTAIEPPAAKLLAENGTVEAHEELRRLVDDVPRAYEAGTMASASANLHRRMVELSGNATLGIIAGMLHEIGERHTAAAHSRSQQHNKVAKAEYARLVKSYARLVDSGQGPQRRRGRSALATAHGGGKCRNAAGPRKDQGPRHHGLTADPTIG